MEGVHILLFARSDEKRYNAGYMDNVMHAEYTRLDSKVLSSNLNNQIRDLINSLTNYYDLNAKALNSFP